MTANLTKALTSVPLKRPLSPATARWQHKRVLSPKDPEEAAVYLDGAIESLIAEYQLSTEVGRQRKAIEHMRISLHHLMHDKDSETLNGLVISGAAGMGKTRMIEEATNEAKRPKHRVSWEEHHKMDHHAMAQVLELYSRAHDVVVFDDVDRMFENSAMLEILKAAQETEKERWISYRPRPTKRIAYPDKKEFQFQGKIIVITNDSVDRMKEKKPKLGPHIDAITTRMPAIDLAISTPRERLACIYRHIREGFFNQTGLKADKIIELARWLGRHMDTIDLNLRTLKRVGEIISRRPNEWEAIAETLHRRRSPKALEALEKSPNGRKHGNARENNGLDESRPLPFADDTARADVETTWSTPPHITQAILQAFKVEKFSLDPASPEPPTVPCSRYFTKETDGLAQNWDGDLIYLNLEVYPRSRAQS
jgi:ATPase family associated with various cellular activities (AAA)